MLDSLSWSLLWLLLGMLIFLLIALLAVARRILYYEKFILTSFHYQYTWDTTHLDRFTVLLKGSRLDLKSLPQKKSTYILQLDFQSDLLGHLFDPQIIVQSIATTTCHCLPRGYKGKIPLNITRHFARKQKPDFLHIRLRFGRLAQAYQAEILIGQEIQCEKILVLATHPDDAEIGSCGLYLSYPAVIVTLTDGSHGQQYAPWTDTQIVAQIRTADSINIPLAIAPKGAAIQSFNLSYPDTQLEFIRQHEPDRWNRLVQEIQRYIDAHQPDVIVTPHPQLDSHPDHVTTTRALKKALQSSRHQPRFLFFTLIHNHVTEMYPFGSLGDEVDLPPLPRDRSHQAPLFTDIYTHILDPDQIRIKANSLELHSDLRERTFSFNISLRQWLTLTRRFFLSLLEGMRYNPTDLFDRFVRPVEIFLVLPTDEFLAQPDP